MNQEETKAKGEGWDACIDMMANIMRKKVEELHAAKRKSTRVDHKDMYQFAAQLFQAMVEELKKAKGNPGIQKFSEEEIRALFDHVSGTVLPKNSSLMDYFDSMVTVYKEGNMELKVFSPKKSDKNGE